MFFPTRGVGDLFVSLSHTVPGKDVVTSDAQVHVAMSLASHMTRLKQEL